MVTCYNEHFMNHLSKQKNTQKMSPLSELTDYWILYKAILVGIRWKASCSKKQNIALQRAGFLHALVASLVLNWGNFDIPVITNTYKNKSNEIISSTHSTERVFHLSKSKGPQIAVIANMNISLNWLLKTNVIKGHTRKYDYFNDTSKYSNSNNQ